jgi:AP-1 complex subunit beta-1
MVSRYASEVDVDFVRKSIKAIGQTAVKIDAAAERCVNVLLELIDTRVSYVVQEAVVVMKVCDVVFPLLKYLFNPFFL